MEDDGREGGQRRGQEMASFKSNANRSPLLQVVNTPNAYSYTL